MLLTNLRISARLVIAFSVQIALMIAIIIVSIVRFTSVGAINDKIIQEDWKSAAAATAIDSAAREDAKRTLALFILPDQAARGKSYAQIDLDKKIIDAALVTLTKLIDSPEDKTALDKVQAARVAYSASFIKVADLVEADKKDDAAAMMNSETFPALDTLLAAINLMVDLQKKQVDEGGASARDGIHASRNLMIGLGIFGVIIGLWLAMSDHAFHCWPAQ